jgi:cytochrome c
MSRFLEVGAFGGAALMLLVAYNVADRNITRVTDLPDRSEFVAAYVERYGMMSAAAADGQAPEPLGLGRLALPEEIAAWDVDVTPDGQGLPEGSGDALTGEPIFEAKCASCHGSFAEGIDNWPELAGGMGTLADEDPLKTVGSYWPYLSTAWDYIHRSMPFGDAQSLTDDEVYAILAYILYSNDLVEDDFVLDRETVASFEMPNAAGFVVDDREETELPRFTAEPCMSDCKDGVEITMRATVLDVTPEEAAAAVPPRPEPEVEVEVVEELAEEPGEEPVQTAAADPAPQPEPEPEPAADPELIAAGEKVFRKCKACHEAGPGARNRSGPALEALLGRKVGSVEGFRYSKVFQEMHDAGTTWDEETLGAFLADPRGFARGTRMSFKGLKDPDDVAAVIAWLDSLAE